MRSRDSCFPRRAIDVCKIKRTVFLDWNHPVANKGDAMDGKKCIHHLPKGREGGSKERVVLHPGLNHDGDPDVTADGVFVPKSDDEAQCIYHVGLGGTKT